MEINTSQLNFDDNDLIAAIVQNAETGKVLTLAYMNKEALQRTIETKETWFYSRKRQQLWNKGETSGNKQQVKKITFDCDADALLVQVEPLGPACHTGSESCFTNALYQQEEVNHNVIPDLVSRIQKRRNNPKDGSYTTYLFNEGIDKILKKVGEEASEVIIGAKNNDKQEVTWEIADLTYHSLVLMELLGVSISDIKKELRKRHIQKEGGKDE
ncbi:bifunctional phosphoribosyl-AMP cyclohydrolase/phosphoribosyl-ATP diphosphatase HisIE [Virgibacillus halodenitrificans]|uniref:Histidine biosynthesis bifunctional protein HisIE n=1 Tax=Virgibacillus halodenitrificans TaxID=1482 RepID=A0AAC9IX89_VIRHA|nr:bifunctional phosphoribosyl-AMP cyclohydrolase/phosphoribosyl-ATP diphosphatase HisIE [Virgibacillus halodenitrificans]APC47028.1 bifunctional phosphoribosyl-AMP cyclohydrolase/phosphoribosyl-ATP pyrophosphatase [Virgibacillus halodenitrificans]MCG1027372.1 bifunctional phosphoribosyl-AMP cyclohydrolase/phosphoribosyl-ATP diphosphatase HisIE [Virgibacillus halodenitrificans]MYL46848.1 bifunctional phosphoribosyl-AMP cyclohydrolase/phosphoribosyl-ATP diphosphatase HisIE [Virgibacillus halodeni